MSGDEADVLWSMADYYRATLLAKCEGLEAAALARATCAPSNLTLLGLLRHATEVEHYWFERVFLGLDAAPPTADRTTTTPCSPTSTRPLPTRSWRHSPRSATGPARSPEVGRSMELAVGRRDGQRREPSLRRRAHGRRARPPRGSRGPAP